MFRAAASIFIKKDFLIFVIVELATIDAFFIDDDAVR